MKINYESLIDDTLVKVFGFKSFKGEQKQIILSVIQGDNSMVIMPTGGGKSLCYQIPALIKDGTAIVISPLIALMKNQVDNLRGYLENESIGNSFLCFLVNTMCFLLGKIPGKKLSK